MHKKSKWHDIFGYIVRLNKQYLNAKPVQSLLKNPLKIKHISFGFILFQNKLKFKFFGRYPVPKHKVSNMSAIYNIEFRTTIKVKSYFDVLK